MSRKKCPGDASDTTQTGHSTSMQNPYQPPQQTGNSAETDNGPQQATRQRSAWLNDLGAALSGMLAILYLLSLGMSVYEYTRQQDNRLVSDYVRTGAASLVFFVLSLQAASCFARDQRSAWRWLLLAAMLLVIAAGPGLNTVWNRLTSWLP